MQLSPSGLEMLFNVIYLGIALLLSFLFLVFYHTSRPEHYGPFKYYVEHYGPLIGALFLILCASLLFGLYSESRDIFLAARGLKPDEEVVRTRLTENLHVLAFVVPAVMLGIAANLITQFLIAPRPLERNGDKSPRP